MTAIPGPAAQLAKVTGDLQVATATTQLPISPSVRVSDQFGNVINGKSVTFAIASGGGTTLGPQQLTSNGVATVGGWILGAAVGTQTVQASVDALSVLFSATATQVLNLTPYVGTYTGTWVNSTFASTGTGTATIADNAATRTATLTAAATGQVLGSGGGLASTTRSNAYGVSAGTISTVVAPLGNVTISVDAFGNVVASGVNIPNVAISRWDATGTISATQILLNFTVTFVSGAPATGTITLTKP